MATSADISRVKQDLSSSQGFACELLEERLKDVVTFRNLQEAWQFGAIQQRFPLSAIATKAAGMGLFMNDGSFFNNPKINYNAIRFGFAFVK